MKPSHSEGQLRPVPEQQRLIPAPVSKVTDNDHQASAPATS